MTLSAVENTLQALNQLLDPDQIVSDAVRSPIQTTPSPTRLQRAFQDPDMLPPVVYPKSVPELRSLMQWANQDQKSVLVCGNGSKLGWSTPIPATDVIISLNKLNRVIDHAVGDLTITVQAGITLQLLQAQLKASSQFLPVDPAYSADATIGGILASRDAGSLRHRYGGVRDLCLGVSFVRADGQLAKGGGRVVKNVAGYDLMKLLTGAFGTLGVMTEVTLRLYPIQEESQSLIISGSTDAIAALTADVLDSTLTPVSIDLLSGQVLNSFGIEHSLGLAVRFQSLRESVIAQVQRLQDLSRELSIQQYDDDQSLWQDLSQTLWKQDSDSNTVIAKVGMLPQSIPSTLGLFHAWCDQQDIQFSAQVLAGWGIGTIKLIGDLSKLDALVPQLRQHCNQNQGYLSLLEAPLNMRQTIDVWGYPGNAIAPMLKLKDQFDPHHIINPGRFVGGI